MWCVRRVMRLDLIAFDDHILVLIVAILVVDLLLRQVPLELVLDTTIMI